MSGLRGAMRESLRAWRILLARSWTRLRARRFAHGDTLEPPLLTPVFSGRRDTLLAASQLTTSGPPGCGRSAPAGGMTTRRRLLCSMPSPVTL
jgi:hypothetical protein